MDDERGQSQDNLISRHLILSPHESYEPASAYPILSLPSMREMPDVSFVTDIHGAIQRPADGEGGICDDLEGEEDDCVFGEDEIEGESEA